jgi:L-histidine N-alpha-methyltransferase
MPEVGSSERLTLEGRPGSALREDFAEAVRAGLGQRPRSLPCRFFYDEQGSRLFEAITRLAEYYPPEAEREILAAHAEEIAASVPPGAELVELGSGSGEKTRLVIAALLARHPRLRYLPIDISRSALEESARVLLSDHPGLYVHALWSDYAEGVRALAARRARPRLVLWLGSSVGNFDREEAAGELRRLRAALAARDRLLLGVDLRKSRAVLERAYDDPAGVTARFNLNLLDRIDRELGGDFASARFRHLARYREEEGRVELFLESERAQRVRIGALGLELDFEAGERIHTENSYKYSRREIEELARAGGFELRECWSDGGGRFCDALLAPSGL